MFGLSKKDYEFIKEQLQDLERNGVKIWCFGSRARGDHHRFSDLDLMIDSEKSLDLKVSEIKEIFEESNLPIKIDIVELKNFADSYRAGFERDKKAF